MDLMFPYSCSAATERCIHSSKSELLCNPSSESWLTSGLKGDVDADLAMTVLAAAVTDWMPEDMGWTSWRDRRPILNMTVLGTVSPSFNN